MKATPPALAGPGPEPASAPAVRPRRKVFYLVDSLEVGGTETQAVELALRMPASGYEITLGCLRAEGPLLARLQGTAVRLEEFHPQGGLDSPGGVYQLARMTGFLRRHAFDVVHTHDLWSNLLGVTAARFAGIPAIISSQRDLSHFDWYKGMRRTLLRKVQGMSQAVLVNATPIRDGLLEEGKLDPQKLRVIHNGVDTDRFQHGRRDRDRFVPGGDDGMFVVLVGNMHDDVKGHPWVIGAAPPVVREFPKTRFVFAGDGAFRPTLERQVADLGLQSNFVFLGRRTDIPDLLASCDIAVLPSRAEGLPNAVLEYMAAGLPTIVSRVGGNPELVQEGVTGMLVPPQDATALSDALLRLLRGPGLARQMAANGRRLATQDFSFDRLIREIDSLYTELLEHRHRRSN